MCTLTFTVPISIEFLKIKTPSFIENSVLSIQVHTLLVAVVQKDSDVQNHTQSRHQEKQTLFFSFSSPCFVIILST